MKQIKMTQFILSENSRIQFVLSNEADKEIEIKTKMNKEDIF